jgi:hypothetical protein
MDYDEQDFSLPLEMTVLGRPPSLLPRQWGRREASSQRPCPGPLPMAFIALHMGHVQVFLMADPTADDPHHRFGDFHLGCIAGLAEVLVIFVFFPLRRSKPKSLSGIPGQFLSWMLSRTLTCLSLGSAYSLPGASHNQSQHRDTSIRGSSAGNTGGEALFHVNFLRFV